MPLEKLINKYDNIHLKLTKIFDVWILPLPFWVVILAVEGQNPYVN